MMLLARPYACKARTSVTLSAVAAPVYRSPVAVSISDGDTLAVSRMLQQPLGRDQLVAAIRNCTSARRFEFEFIDARGITRQPRVFMSQPDYRCWVGRTVRVQDLRRGGKAVEVGFADVRCVVPDAWAAEAIERMLRSVQHL